MTRTHKDNIDMLPGAAPRVPKYFGKTGFNHTDPKSTKKNGSGKANWGELGADDILDDEFNFSHQRRRSNSNSFGNAVRTFKTKFDVNEPEPVFEEDVHGPSDDEEHVSKADSSESASNASSEV